MGLLDKLTSILPFGKKEPQVEYFFALNISNEKLTAALWNIDGSNLQILETATDTYTSLQDLLRVTDSLLDKVLGVREIEPEKILFGVPDSWLVDDDLRGEYLKVLRNMIKDLELSPMAYVASSHALIHYLEKTEGVPTTAILVGFEAEHLTVSVVRAGRLDGTRVVGRGENGGVDIEKALLAFTNVETLPSKILIYGLEEEKLEKIKNELHEFSWMQNLSFLHVPKIEILPSGVEIESICYAGGFEVNNEIVFVKNTKAQITKPASDLKEIKEGESEPSEEIEPAEKEESVEKKEMEEESKPELSASGFVMGDISEQINEEEEKENLVQPPDQPITRHDDFSKELAPPAQLSIGKFKLPAFFNISFVNKLIEKAKARGTIFFVVIVLIIFGIIGAYLLLPKADVKIFVEPQILEKETQVIADPKQKEIDREAKIIPGELVTTEVSGSDSIGATGSREIGDPAKGTVVLRNKTDREVTLSKGAVLTNTSGLKFNLDTSVSIASRSADDGTWGKSTTEVSAQSIGADGNLPSGTDLSIANYSSDQLVAKSEGNFSGGTSKEVTVVSAADQEKLLAKVAANLRTQAKDKLQEQLPDKKVIEESLSEDIIRRSYNKNVNDQASEFTLNLTVRFRGTAFDENNLKQIVGDLVTTEVPEGFELSLENTETQSSVKDVEKDGKLIFSAKFRAKLIPKLNQDEIKNKIRGRTADEVAQILKEMEGILGSEIRMNPSLPSFLQRLPLIENNIQIEVGLK
ncbi:MAG: hypothetical protein Q8P92_05525 [Candidatus Daviesbacteria bacterium]|nr:hypothetical protein [Candidatus Daviesbacteria bacterium]